MLCISVSYKKTTGELRQRFSFSQDEQKEFLHRLTDDRIISGGVILSTCNRSELYITVNRKEKEDHSVHAEEEIGFGAVGRTLSQIEELFAEYKGLSRNEIRKNCLFYHGKQAVLHLYKVVCGLDSMVLGEDEILHQVKEAYQASQGIGVVDGELNILFQGAFNCAKLSKSETHISETPISIGTLTANYIEEYLKVRMQEDNRKTAHNNKQEDKNVTAKMHKPADDNEVMDCNRDKGDADACGRVLVIGASGQIGSIVAKDLIAKNIPVIGTSRSHTSDDRLWRSDEMTWISFGSRYEYINNVSVIVSATKSPHYTLTVNEFREERGDSRSILLVDLAVPYDIDRDIEKEKGVKLIGIDHFKELSEKNSVLKLSEAKKMESIVSECVEDVLKRLYIRNFQALMPEREEWFSKMIFYLKTSLDSDTLLRVLERIYSQECE